MNFTTEFLLNSCLASLFNVFFYGIPGLLISNLLQLPKHFRSEALLYASALGIATLGPFLLVFCNLFGFGSWQVLIGWGIFTGLAFKAQSYLHTNSKAIPFYPKALWVVMAAALCALLPAYNITPHILDQGLFVNEYIFDHIKIAFIDSMVRENLPPLNPFYAPEGQRIELVYYYGWHFYAAISKMLLGFTGWQAETAFSWLSGFAFITFPAALAIRFTGRNIAGLMVCLLILTGPPADILPYLTGPGWENWFAYPSVHPLEVPWIQLSWAPQHVFAALCSFMLIFLLAHYFNNKDLAYPHGIVLGLIAAAGFSCSVWVGGVALAAIAPILVIALLLAKADFSKLLAPFAVALLVCVLFSLPVLISVTSGESQHESVLGWHNYWSTNRFDQSDRLKYIGHMVFYWLQFLPLSLGPIYILGMFAVLCYKTDQQELKRFHLLSIAAIFAYLLLIKFVRSTIMNNDFGWRSVMVPNLLLLLWAAIALVEIPARTGHWRSFAVKLRNYRLFVPGAAIVVIIGLLSTLYLALYQKSLLDNAKKDPIQLKLHQDFLSQNQAWEALRQITSPDAIVQNNPKTYATTLTPWSAPASLALFANRATAYGDPESVNVFAHSYSMEQKERQRWAILKLFSAEADIQDFQYANQVLNIDALLIDTRDPVWNSDIIEQSGYYTLGKKSPFYKIYTKVPL